MKRSRLGWQELTVQAILKGGNIMGYSCIECVFSEVDPGVRRSFNYPGHPPEVKG